MEKQQRKWKFFFFSSRRRHTRYWRDWSSDVCSSDLDPVPGSSFIDIIAKFEADPETELIVMSGEIGGSAEEEAAEYIGENRPEERRGGEECRSRWLPYH